MGWITMRPKAAYIDVEAGFWFAFHMLVLSAWGKEFVENILIVLAKAMMRSKCIKN